MNFGAELKNENIEYKSNLLSRIFFIWTIPLVRKGLKNPLKLGDLFKVVDDDKTENLTRELEQCWKEELKTTSISGIKPRLQKVMWKLYLRRALPFYALILINSIFLKILPCVMLQKLTAKFIVDDSDGTIGKWILGTLLILFSFISCIFHQFSNYNLTCLAIRMRASTSSLIYIKVLRMSMNSLEKISAGKIVNILSNDLNRFIELVIGLQYFVIGPLQLLVITLSMWQFIGLPSITGMLFLVIFALPFEIIMGKLSSTFRRKVAKAVDTRVKLMNEIISGIKVIKLYAWEKPFEKLVELARESELEQIMKYLTWQVFFYNKTIQKISSYLSIISIFFINKTITSDAVFSCFQYMSVLRNVFLVWFPRGVAVTLESLVTFDRVNELLLLEEVSRKNEEGHEVGRILFNNVTAAYSPDSEFQLRLDGIDIAPGTLCAIVGQVGSGKSSVLHLLLRELFPKSGQIMVGGSIAYSSQETWLFSSTVRENILFGQEYHDLKYKNVINACNLEVDFERFPNGDFSLVGERGVILSGGQKARINLARAIYRDSDIYLLDDPLSAVDTEVGRHLFDRCILTYLKGKTRLIVTHQLHYLEKADLIIFIDKGVGRAYGSLKELTAERNRDIVLSEVDTQSELNEHNKKELILKDNDKIVFETGKKFQDLSEEDTPRNNNAILEYLKSSGSFWSLIFNLFLFTVVYSLYTFSDYWLALWCRKEYSSGVEETVLVTINTTQNISLYEYGIVPNVSRRISAESKEGVIIYSGLMFAIIFVTVYCNHRIIKFFVAASKKLHENMFHNLLKVPMSFFNMYPSGRILNRFSSDMGTIDESFPESVKSVCEVYFFTTATVVVIITTNWYMFPFMIVVLYVYWKLQNLISVIGKQTKHLEVVAKSPVFSFFISSLMGITTIRASEMEHTLKTQFYKLMDTYTSAARLCNVCAHSFSFWVDFIGIIIIATTVYFFIALHNTFNGSDASFVGLGIYHSLQLSAIVQYGMRRSIDVIHSVVSIERIIEYSKLPTEDCNENIRGILHNEWPQTGKIEYKNVSMKYSDTLALRGITFTINPKEKVGVVGRTGAGKSSLITALFSLSQFDGIISIDGVDTKTIKLDALRRSISIIPQDPVLFSETIRHNLDPFGQCTDSQIWDALDQD
nr:multidrug resistance-associated protein 4-like isoform X2 [Leptinotarsa decemlineata]